MSDHAVLSLSKTILEGNAGDQIGAFGGPYAAGTRALVSGSFVEGGVRSGNIEFFIDARDNFQHRPESDGDAAALYAQIEVRAVLVSLAAACLGYLFPEATSAILAGTEPGPPGICILRHVCAVTGGPTAVSAGF